MDNKVRVDGFLQDFELRVLKSGGSVGCGSISFGGGKTKDGKPLKRSYVKFEIWNPKIEICNALEDGAKQERKPVVRLNGRLREDTWPDKVTGKTVRLLKVVADDIVVNPEGAFKPRHEDSSAPSPAAVKTAVAKQAVKAQAPQVRRAPSPPPPPPADDPVDVPPPPEEDLPF
jgi:single-stranded DNA-binding protein